MRLYERFKNVGATPVVYYFTILVTGLTRVGVETPQSA